MTEWISVKECGLPKKNGEYIVAANGLVCGYIYAVVGFTTNLFNVDNSDFRGRKRPGFYNYDSELGIYEVTNVTHWMELPELPKEE